MTGQNPKQLREMKLQKTLAIMLKEPRPGRVKTRLARDLGKVAAAWWFRHQSNALVRRLCTDPRGSTIAAVAPDEATASRALPAQIRKIPQGRGDLGARMKRVFVNAPPGPVVIIGADIPGIERHHIKEAFDALGRADTVFGPAPDGGYWLIGLKRGSKPVPKRLFENVRWSSSYALEDTVRSLGASASIARIAQLQDVDEIGDLRQLSARRG